MSKYFLTTPIYYVNARPHIGHAYTTIVADVLARRHRLLGEETFFLTGTDEHGQKIERSAQAAGVPPQQFADQVSESFRTLWQRMGITNDAFIRTTDEAHKRGVQKLFAALWEKGFIYLDSYTGAYCVSDETFVDVAAGTPCPDCGRVTETVTEENFFFKLSAFQVRLIDLIEAGELQIENEARRNEVLSFLRGNVSGGEATARSHAGTLYVPGALRDLSVSRSSFTWGIAVPEPAASEAAQKHVVYVWLDALANYMTALGYGAEDDSLWQKYWPADLHIVGKEIIRFHCVYWPAFLLAADLPIPKKIVAHGWLLFDDSKMSKSKGNIVRTETILEAFGTEVYEKQFPERSKVEQDLFASDVLRYFLLREIPFGQDGSFSFDAMITRYNADLANGYGNLVSRTLTMIERNCDASIPEHTEWSESTIVLVGPRAIASSPPRTQKFVTVAELDLARVAAVAVHFYQEAFSNLRFSMTVEFSQLHKDLLAAAEIAVEDRGALDFVVLLIDQTDRLMSAKQPWKLAKSTAPEDQQGLCDTLYIAAESIRIITALLYPVLPFATASVWRQLGLGEIEDAARNGELTNLTWGGLKPGTKLGALAPVFPRAEKGLAQIMANMEAPAPPAATLGSTEQNDATHRATDDFKTGPIASQAGSSAQPGNEQAATRQHDPAAGPRTATIPEPNPGAHVAGSAAETTERTGTPSHTEAPASGIFAHQPADASPQITIDDFAKVELRVAQVLVCERIPKADKLLRLEVDLGYEKRQILSGIAEWYTPEELIGRRIVVITNLAPRKMRGLESHGMLLAASAPEGGKPALATFLDQDTLPLGARLK